MEPCLLLLLFFFCFFLKEFFVYLRYELNLLFSPLHQRSLWTGKPLSESSMNCVVIRRWNPLLTIFEFTGATCHTCMTARYRLGTKCILVNLLDGSLAIWHPIPGKFGYRRAVAFWFLATWYLMKPWSIVMLWRLAIIGPLNPLFRLKIILIFRIMFNWQQAREHPFWEEWLQAAKEELRAKHTMWWLFLKAFSLFLSVGYLHISSTIKGWSRSLKPLCVRGDL